MLRIYLQTPMQRLHPGSACALLVVALLGLSALAQAQQLATPASSEMTQSSLTQHSWPVAVALFSEGTKLFKQWRFDEAEQKFREALAQNEHPLIHVYLSRALEKQGRLVEAYEALLPVLRPGSEPLPPEDVQVTEVLQKSVESRLAQLEVHCDVPGTRVSLDGELWFVVLGPKRRMVSAGQHVLVARKSRYFPVAELVSLIPGQQTRVVIRMTADVTHVERRWQPWQPWAVAATGVAISLAGQWLRQQQAQAGCQGCALPILINQPHDQ